MDLRNAIAMARLILGDESESIWSDDQLISALNLSNKRIMARIVAQNPVQWVISYEDFIYTNAGDSSVTPLSVSSGTESFDLYGALKTAWTAEGAAATRFTLNPIKIMKIYYSTNASLTERVNIPLVPFESLDELKDQQVLEYEVLSRVRYGQRMYKASYSEGVKKIYIRPIPANTLYLKIYWAEAGVPELTTSTDLDQPLLLPFAHETNTTSHENIVQSTRAEAVVFDACWTLSFKDDSMRKAFAQERDRILSTQHIPYGPSEAY